MSWLFPVKLKMPFLQVWIIFLARFLTDDLVSYALFSMIAKIEVLFLVDKWATLSYKAGLYKLLFWTAFWKLFSGIPRLPGFGDVPGARCRHLPPKFPGARCFVQGDRKGGQVERPRTCIKDVLSLTVNVIVRVWNCAPLLTKSAK